MHNKKTIILNYVSLIIMAMSGLVINAIIIIFYDSATLGIYNETYAWYMMLSQIAVWGIHMAVVKFVPEVDDKKEKGTILKSALLLVVISSVCVTTVVAIVIYFLKFPWRKSLYVAISGLIFFSINKVFLNYLNALCKMVTYALLQSVRYILLMLIVFAIATIGFDGNYLSSTFLVTEFILFFIMVLYFILHKEFNGRFDKCTLKKILHFGTRILPSNMVLEMNTKVDVVCLGILSVDSNKVGVYSFAILFTDGLYQLFITLRKIINPHIAKENKNMLLEEYLKKFFAKIKRYFYLLSILALLAIMTIYGLGVLKIIGNEYMPGFIYIFVIGISIVLSGKYIVLGDILAQTGYPLSESKVNIITIVFNFVCNLICIWNWGTVGAALSTALSYVLFAVVLECMSREKTLISIIKL